MDVTFDNLKIDVSGKDEVDGSSDGVDARSELVPDASSNPNHIIISGDAEVEAKAGASIGGKTAAIGGGIVGEIPNDALSNDDHKVTGGSLTRCDSDGKKMEDYSYDRRTPSQWEQPDDTENSDDEDGPRLSRRTALPRSSSRSRPQTPGRKTPSGYRVLRTRKR